MLVLKGLVGLHSTIQLQLLRITGWDIDLDYHDKNTQDSTINLTRRSLPPSHNCLRIFLKREACSPSSGPPANFPKPLLLVCTCPSPACSNYNLSVPRGQGLPSRSFSSDIFSSQLTYLNIRQEMLSPPYSLLPHYPESQHGLSLSLEY